MAHARSSLPCNQIICQRPVASRLDLFLPSDILRRHKPDFSAVCRTALVSYLADAVSDVRTLHSLKQDCTDDIARCGLLCCAGCSVCVQRVMAIVDAAFQNTCLPSVRGHIACVHACACAQAVQWDAAGPGPCAELPAGGACRDPGVIEFVHCFVPTRISRGQTPRTVLWSPCLGQCLRLRYDKLTLMLAVDAYTLFNCTWVLHRVTHARSRCCGCLVWQSRMCGWTSMCHRYCKPKYHICITSLFTTAVYSVTGTRA